jgi:hypothetical protein
MTKRITTGLAMLVLLGSAGAWAQTAAIPECRNALATLRSTGQLANVGTLISQSCPNVYGGVWYSGLPASKEVSPACYSAWDALSANPSAAAAGKEFATRNCPDMYMTLGWRGGPGPAYSPTIPACSKAVNDLQALGKAAQAGNALKNRCNQLYANGWLVQLGGPGNACEVIWTGLTSANALGPARELITHNCPWLYNNNYAATGAPISP